MESEAPRSLSVKRNKERTMRGRGKSTQTARAPIALPLAASGSALSFIHRTGDLSAPHTE
jgi:hypothetical protein